MSRDQVLKGGKTEKVVVTKYKEWIASTSVGWHLRNAMNSDAIGKLTANLQN